MRWDALTDKIPARIWKSHTTRYCNSLRRAWKGFTFSLENREYSGAPEGLVMNTKEKLGEFDVLPVVSGVPAVLP